MKTHIGFMQGRLCDPVDGKIQAFPWRDWESEFRVAQSLSLNLMEWTLDQEGLYENPLLTPEGQSQIRRLSAAFGVAIPSLTGDCFMQAPFWKVDGEARLALQADFRAVCRACSAVGIRQVLVPLVDHGRLEDTAQEEVFVQFLLEQSGFLADANLQVIVESDFEPAELARLMARLPEDRFGVNYDIGNSAALGHNPGAEFAAYGSRIVNVHVKDRRLGGTTVPLKTGNADFDAVFEGLAGLKYQGNFILQTARAEDGDHANALRQYRDLTAEWMTRYGLRATASPPLCD